MSNTTWDNLSVSMQQAIRTLLREERGPIHMGTVNALINRGLIEWIGGGLGLTDAGRAVIPERVKALWLSSRIAPSLARRAEDARVPAVEYREAHGNPVETALNNAAVINRAIFAPLYSEPEPQEVDAVKALKLAEFYLQRALDTSVLAAVHFDVARALDELRKLLAAEQAGGE